MLGVILVIRYILGLYQDYVRGYIGVNYEAPSSLIIPAWLL